jgi:thioester reductase-like protein
MGAVLLTGATGFVGGEVLNRFLQQQGRRVYALVRAKDDDAAAQRLPSHARLTAVAGDIEAPRLGLRGETAARIEEDVTRVVHCAASVSFTLPLPSYILHVYQHQAGGGAVPNRRDKENG